ncbi:unnamed protein product, partial [Discosporangium mesarthrocarpum]
MPPPSLLPLLWRQGQAVSETIFTREGVDALLNLLGSSWDRSRYLAADLLGRFFPRPLPGYGGPGGSAALAARGLRLSGSARVQGSGAGATILRLVFMVYALGLG